MEDPDIANIPKTRTQVTPISSSQKKAIEQALAHIQSSVKDLEIKNHEIIYDSDSPYAHNVMIRIPPPTSEQMEGISRELKEAVDVFPSDSPAGKEMLERGYSLTMKYVSYPKPVKVLRFCELADGTIKDFWEWYVDDAKMVMPDANGMLPIPLPPQAVLRVDGNFGSPKSWAADRYSHLISVDPE